MNPDSGCILTLVQHQHCAVWTNRAGLFARLMIDHDPTLRTSASVWLSLPCSLPVLESSLSNALDVLACRRSLKENEGLTQTWRTSAFVRFESCESRQPSKDPAVHSRWLKRCSPKHVEDLNSLDVPRCQMSSRLSSVSYKLKALRS